METFSPLCTTASTWTKQSADNPVVFQINNQMNIHPVKVIMDKTECKP